MYHPVRGIGSVGVLADLSPYEVPANAWTHGNNVRLDDRAIRRDRGYSGLLSIIGGSPVHVAGWWALTASYWVVILNDATFHRWDGSLFDGIVPSGGALTPGGRWHTETVGQWMIATDRTNVPQQIAVGSLVMDPLENWEPEYLAGQIVSWNSFLFAVGITKNGTPQGGVVKWSDVVAPDGVPPTWVPGVGSLAGEVSLDAGATGIYAAKTLGQSLILYGLQDVWRVDPTGNAANPFSFRRLFSQDGAYSPDVITDLFGQHLVVGPRSIYLHSGTPTKTRVAEDKIERTFYASLGDGTVMQSSSNRNEAWVLYSSNPSSVGPYTPLDKALVYNVDMNQWTFCDVPNITQITPGPVFGVINIWTDLDYAWTEITGTWDQLSEQPVDGVLLMCGYTDNIIYSKDTQTSRNGEPVPVFLANYYMDLDILLQDSTQRPRMIAGILPQVAGKGTLSIRIGTSDEPGAPILWGPTQSFEVGTDYKVDFRQTGRYLSWEITENSVDADWWLTGYDIDIRQRGKR